MMILLPTRVTANSTQPITHDEVDTGAAAIDGVDINDTSIDGDDIDGDVITEINTNYVRALIIKSVCINLLLLQRIVDCV